MASSQFHLTNLPKRGLGFRGELQREIFQACGGPSISSPQRQGETRNSSKTGWSESREKGPLLSFAISRQSRYIFSRHTCTKPTNFFLTKIEWKLSNTFLGGKLQRVIAYIARGPPQTALWLGACMKSFLSLEQANFSSTPWNICDFQYNFYWDFFKGTLKILPKR